MDKERQKTNIMIFPEGRTSDCRNMTYVKRSNIPVLSNLLKESLEWLYVSRSFDFSSSYIILEQCFEY